MKKNDLKKWIIIALLFSWLGDVLLMLQGDNSIFFLLGLSAFLLAHVFYILFFHFVRVRENVKSRWYLLLIVVIYYALLISILSPWLGEMKLPVRIYGIVISFMFMLAMHMLFIKNNRAGLLMMAGALLFVISDSVLAINKFYHPFEMADVVHLIHFATETGTLLLDGFGDGICLGMTAKSYEHLAASFEQVNSSGRNYLSNQTTEQFINNTAFSILQATRTRISKTEYISCPSCGRTLFDLQETTAKIRSRTNHLKGVKIAIMGCIVNGPGEMADADFGYVGSGPGKITLYKGKEVMKRNVNSEVAVEELINLLKENDAWVAP